MTGDKELEEIGRSVRQMRHHVSTPAEDQKAYGSTCVDHHKGCTQVDTQAINRHTGSLEKAKACGPKATFTQNEPHTNVSFCQK